MKRLASSPRSQVWESELGGTPVIVKRVTGDAEFARELAALRLAASSGVVPQVLSADPGRRELILEYLPHENPGPGWRVAWAHALAHLHTNYHPGRREAGLPPWSAPGPADAEAFLRLAAALGVTGFDDAVFVLLDRLPTLGPAALLHGDPCPANDRHTPAGVRFVDLEQAAIGPGLVELAYLRIGFPTCWCVTVGPAAELAEAEATYAAITGTPLDGLADACAGWLIRGDALVERADRDGTDHLARLLHEDWEWGTATARERLAFRLKVVASLDHELSELASSMSRAVVGLWPGLRTPPAVRAGV